MYIEGSHKISGSEISFVSFERTDIIQISNISFFYNTYSISTDDSLQSMSRSRIQLFLENNTWTTGYNTPKNDRYSNSSTKWILVSSSFIIENYGIKIIFDQIDTPHAVMCFSNISIARSVF